MLTHTESSITTRATRPMKVAEVKHGLKAELAVRGLNIDWCGTENTGDMSTYQNLSLCSLKEAGHHF